MAPPVPLPKGKNDRRKLLIYGGVAVAMLVVLLLRRQQSGQAAAASDPNALTPVGTPAASGGSGGVTDNSAQLASFENGLLDQLPQVISSSIAAGFANWVPPAAPAAATDPSTPTPSQFDPASFVAAASSLIGIGVGLAGAANGKPAGGPTGTTVKSIPHPATVATHGATPGAKYTTTTETRNGVRGVVHHYADHTVFVPSTNTRTP